MITVTDRKRINPILYYFVTTDKIKTKKDKLYIWNINLKKKTKKYS